MPSTLQKYKLLISYDGTSYSGWQVQLNAPSIQEEIEKALYIFFKVPIRLIGSGRTDAGVHAVGQVAHFESPKRVDPYRFLPALNGMIPKDIRIKEIEEVPNTFHAQHSAYSKIYHYHVCREAIIDPFVRRYRTHYHRSLDLPLLKEATKLFLGEHDFTTFANIGSNTHTSVRHLIRLDYIEQEGGFRLEFEGSGFLYKMVRNITGVLFDIARGRLLMDEIPKLFAAKDRRKIGMAAPASGLFLMHVRYKVEEKLECAQISSQLKAFPTLAFPLTL